MGDVVHSITLSNDHYIKFRHVSWRMVALNTNCAEKEIRIDEDYNYTSITFDSEFVIKLGDKFEYKYGDTKYKFRVGNIIVRKDTIFLLEESQNDTRKLILPVLGIPIDKIGSPYLVNPYLFINKQEENNKYLYLVYKYVDNKEYKELETFLKTTKYYISTSEPNYEYTTFKFLIEPRYREDINLFLEGKYSQFHKELKKKILKFHGAGPTSDIGLILDRNEAAVQALEKRLDVKLPEGMDIYPKINIEKEIFYYG